MARLAYDDECMYKWLGIVVGFEDGGRISTGPQPPEPFVRMERDGWLWLRPRSYGYAVEPTREGCAAAHRWASRRAKEAAEKFARGVA